MGEDDRRPAVSGRSPTDPAAAGPDAQTVTDRDQTVADTDQTLADADQSASDSDQAAADEDQAASDRDRAKGGDHRAYRASREIRDRTTRQRRVTAQARLEGAAVRDSNADKRDRAAAARDRAAAVRDEALSRRDAAWSLDQPALTGAEVLGRAAEHRRLAAADRTAAASGRARAALDRLQASIDRERAGRDREQARADREALLEQLAAAQADPLARTGTRSAGLVEVDAEIAQARRTASTLIAASVVVDPDGAGAAHDHPAGDGLVSRTTEALRRRLRPHDLIVRLGGDRMVCVMPGATLDDAAERIGALRASLAAAPVPCRLEAGFASLAPQDTAEQLVERADADLQGRLRRGPPDRRSPPPDGV